MNYVGHVAVARSSPWWPSAGFQAGVVAPDLCASAGVAVQAATPEVARGVAHHHRADAAFHGLPWFRATVAALAADLEGAGVRRGPARGAAHVGCELLLDGELLADPAVAGALAQAWATLGRHGPEVAGLAPPAQQPAWRRWLGGFVAHVDPRRYADPGAAALATARILARRPRLAVAPHEEAAVAGALAAHAPAVRAGAPAALAAVADRVGA